jgi:oxalate decarboxylase/phosphoglucose isomerase-like protein (cupin superfamily)
LSSALAGKFTAEIKEDFYRSWVRNEGLEIIPAHYIPDLRKLELKKWERRRGSAVFINHEESNRSNDCYVCEIPPGGNLNQQRQMYEEMVYILDGRGSTVVWNDRGDKVSFEWQTGSLFAIPLNAWYIHYNASGVKPARYVGVTNAPLIMNVFQDAEFIFNTKHDFVARFGGEPEYFAPSPRLNGFFSDTNFVPDTRRLKLVEAKERGADGGHIRFNLAKGTMNSHISEFPVGTYKKAHRHGPGAHVIIVSGKGYTFMWPEGKKPQRYDWQEGSMVVPPNMWFHQHFNTGNMPARYIALKYEGTTIRNEEGIPKAWISSREGGDQIDYADEDELIRKTFLEELAKSGVQSRMQKYYEAEAAKLRR